MPRNRQHVDRDERVEEILRAGERVVRAGGYEGLSFNVIATELGLARGAVYWYFRSKDELFAASAARAIQTALSDPPRRTGYVNRILWAVEQLAELQPIHTALQDRARHSEAVGVVLQGIQDEMCARLQDELRPHLDAARVEPVARTIVIFVQGLLGMPLSRKDRQRHLRFLLEQLIP